MPVAGPPLVTPFTCQVTAVFDVPETAALKLCVAPGRTLALEGETLTVMPEPEEGGLGLEFEVPMVVPAQPARRTAARTAGIAPGK